MCNKQNRFYINIYNKKKYLLRPILSDTIDIVTHTNAQF